MTSLRPIKNQLLSVRIAQEEKRLIDEAANLAETTTAQWVRRVLLTQARKELQQERR